MGLLLFAAVCGGWGSACQTYDFEPVQPLAIAQTTQERVIQARGARPELMLLLDKSGSMDLPIDPSNPACTVGGKLCGRKGEVDFFACDTSVCPTRWSELQTAMASFIPATGNLARFGLSTFPGGTAPSLGAPGCFEPAAPLDASGLQGVTVELSTSDDIPFELESHANTVLAAINQIQSANPPGALGTGGGTPAGPALRMLAQYTPLTTSPRDRFILMLTDGVPNCNNNNVNAYPDAACQCTLDTAQRCQALADFGYGRDACLDANNTESAAADLLTAGVKTIVVGFGAETAAAAAGPILNAIAQAGGFARNCVSPNTCDSGESCDGVTHLCARSYYQAANADELTAQLEKISEIVLPNPCTYDLDARPVSDAFLEVTFEGVRLVPSPTTWDLTSDGRVQFFGTYCDRLKASTSVDSVDVTFRIVQAL
jgi:hypothetical protein